jgi:prepilin-type N-terminal cleavage/methylation domain-containing protein
LIATEPVVVRHSIRAFTLVELLIAISLLGLLTLLLSRLFNTAASTTSASTQRMESEGQIRPLLDRMATDFAQIPKRADLDFYGKGTATGGTMSGNDRIAFFSMVPGDYPSTGSESPFSVIAYKVNSSVAAANATVYTRLQRMARGLLMNGDSSAISDGPLPFSPINISTVWPGVSSNAATDAKYEVAGPQVFRFEYYYLLTNGRFSITPWDPSLPGHTAPDGMRDVAAIVVAVATLDSRSRVLLSNSQVAAIAGTLVDYVPGNGPGWLLTQWQDTLNSQSSPSIQGMPRSILSGVRLYERWFFLAPIPQ